MSVDLLDSDGEKEELAVFVSPDGDISTEPNSSV